MIKKSLKCKCVILWRCTFSEEYSASSTIGAPYRNIHFMSKTEKKHQKKTNVSSTMSSSMSSSRSYKRLPLSSSRNKAARPVPRKLKEQSIRQFLKRKRGRPRKFVKAGFEDVKRRKQHLKNAPKVTTTTTASAASVTTITTTTFSMLCESDDESRASKSTWDVALEDRRN